MSLTPWYKEEINRIDMLTLDVLTISWLNCPKQQKRMWMRKIDAALDDRWNSMRRRDAALEVDRILEEK